MDQKQAICPEEPWSYGTLWVIVNILPSQSVAPCRHSWGVSAQMYSLQFPEVGMVVAYDLLAALQEQTWAPKQG